MTTNGVAARLNVDASTVARWIRTGKLKPDLKAPGLRGAYMFSVETVEKFAAEREAPAAESA
jgi:predicted site-specific integrase-resolvase